MKEAPSILKETVTIEGEYFTNIWIPNEMVSKQLSECLDPKLEKSSNILYIQNNSFSNTEGDFGYFRRHLVAEKSKKEDDKESDKESAKESAKFLVEYLAKEAAKEGATEADKETAKETAKEYANFLAKEEAKEEAKEPAKEPAKEDCLIDKIRYLYSDSYQRKYLIDLKNKIRYTLVRISPSGSIEALGTWDGIFIEPNKCKNSYNDPCGTKYQRNGAGGYDRQ